MKVYGECMYFIRRCVRGKCARRRKRHIRYLWPLFVRLFSLERAATPSPYARDGARRFPPTMYEPPPRPAPPGDERAPSHHAHHGVLFLQGSPFLAILCSRPVNLPRAQQQYLVFTLFWLLQYHVRSFFGDPFGSPASPHKHHSIPLLSRRPIHGLLCMWVSIAIDR